jgi:hypothetical protein
LAIKEVIDLEFAEFNQGDVGQRLIELGLHGLVSSLLQLKVSYFEGLNSHLALKVSRF